MAEVLQLAPARRRSLVQQFNVLHQQLDSEGVLLTALEPSWSGLLRPAASIERWARLHATVLELVLATAEPPAPTRRVWETLLDCLDALEETARNTKSLDKGVV